MSSIDYKTKYQELKNRFMNSVDLAFRLGYEQGAQDAQIESMQQQQMQAAAAAQNQPGQQNPPAEQGSNQEPNDTIPSEDSSGSELDQHISELESSLGKSELNVDDLKKSLDAIKKVQGEIKQKNDLKKSAESIKAISKSLHKPEFKVSQNANHNLSNAAKHSLNSQEQIVQDLMKKWASEETKSVKDISQILSVEGIIKGE